MIFGNGSMAKVYLSYLRQHYEVLGFCTYYQPEKSQFEGYPIHDVAHFESTFQNVEGVFVAVGYLQMNDIRKHWFQVFMDQGISIYSYCDSQASVHDNVIYGKNVMILEGTVVHPNTSIGNNVFIGNNVSIGHDCVIGDNAWINSGCNLAGGVSIGDNSFLGVGVNIGHNSQIGQYNLVTAGVTVGQSTEDNQVWVTQGAKCLPMSSKTFLKFNERMQ